MKDLPIVFDGNKRVGENIKNSVYLWTENDIPCYVGITTQKIFERVDDHLRTQPGLIINAFSVTFYLKNYENFIHS